MGRRFHPWRALGRRPEVVLVFADPGAGLLGSVDFESLTITLAPDLLQRERRTTLTHELIHLERGPAPDRRREETVVELETARRLIDLDSLVQAAQWTDDVHELAVELWVDEAAVQVRLRHLTDDEQALVLQARRERDGDEWVS